MRVVARVAPGASTSAEFEVELAQRLAETGARWLRSSLESSHASTCVTASSDPVDLLRTRATSRSRQPTTRTRSSDCMSACARSISRRPLHRSSRGGAKTRREPRTHSGARRRRPGAPQQHVAKPETRDRRPRRRRAVAPRRAAPRQRARHEEGLLFIDLETCCRGPVEFDIAHVPEEVSEHYPDADQELVRECRVLTLAMVAAWRWGRDDQHPNGRRAGRELLIALREGPPWPTLDAVWPG